MVFLQIPVATGVACNLVETLSMLKDASTTILLLLS